jgi:hypothetical protein
MKRVLLLLACLLLLASFSFSQEGGEAPPAEPPPAAVEPPPAAPEQPPAPSAPEPIAPPSVPPGCMAQPTPTGTFEVKCDLPQQSQPVFEQFDVSEQINSCTGRFELLNGIPTCITEGQGGFTGTECPSQEQLTAVQSSCSGSTEQFLDSKGCTAIMCKNDSFKQRFDQQLREQFGNQPLMVLAMQCQKNGGTMVGEGSETVCVNPLQQTVQIKPELGPVSPQQLQAAAQKLGQIGTKLPAIVEKLESLKEKALEEQAVTVFETGIEQLEEMQEKIAAIQEGLDSSLTEEDRKNMLKDIQEVQQDLLNLATGVATGKIPTPEEIQLRVKGQLDEWYGRPFTQEQFEQWKQEERSAQETVQHCNEYPNGTSFDPPDPDEMVVLVELKPENGKCRLVITTKMGKTASFLVPKEKYENFTGPESFIDQPCSGEACSFLTEMMKSVHGVTPEEQCTEKCVFKDCSAGHFACMEKNLTNCENECGLRKQGEGPIGPNGEIDNMQACTMLCVQDAGGNPQNCGPGKNDPICNQCEEQCINAYGAGAGYERCLTGAQAETKKAACSAQGMFAEPVEEMVMDKTCIVDYQCKPMPPPGQGPPTGQAIMGSAQNFFDGVVQWLGGLFK